LTGAAAMSLRNDLYEVWTLGGLSVGALLRRVYRSMVEDDVLSSAAALAYYFLFALFPFLMFLAALLAYIPIPDLMDQIMELIGDLVPEAAFGMIEDNVEVLVTQQRGDLLSVGIVLALWLSSNAIAAISDSLNRAYRVRESRPFWLVRGSAILLTVGLAVLIISSMTLLIFGPQLGHWLADYLQAGAAFDVLWRLLRWPIIVFLMVFALALVYYFTPDVEQEWRWLTPGSLLATLMWLGVSLLFAYDVENFGQDDRTYGSIGAVIVLLTWMYLSGLSLLIGGEINAEIEHAAGSGKSKGEKELPEVPSI
jgi:membrane protein